MKTTSTIVAVVIFGSSVVHADKRHEADELFKRAKKLLAEKKYAEACPKFEESYKLDPGIGGELNIGKCYEEWGKLGRAYRAYLDAAEQAKDANDPRVAKIQGLAAALEPQVPRLVIHVPPGTEATIAVTIDGVPVSRVELAKPQLVDPGPKEIAYTIGGVKKTKTIPVERGGTSDVTLDVPKPVTTEPAQVDDSKPEPEKPEPVVVHAHDDDTGRTQRIAGIAVGAAGVVGIAVGTYLAFSARSKYNNALAADCMNMKDMCDPQGLTDTHDARSDANIATIVGGIGVAALAGGIVLYVIAPHAATSEHAYYVVPTGNGLAFGGRL